MSLLSVSAIENTGSPVTNIAVNTDGSVTIALPSTVGAPSPVQIGTLWYDTAGTSGTTGVVIFDGTNWVPLGVSPATLAEAAAGVLTTKYSSPQTSVPKDASGMTGAALLPTGTTGEQPGTLVAGMTRFNTTTGDLEFYTGSAWDGATAKVLGAGATYNEGASLLPSGTTAQRPAAPASGMVRVNTDTLPQLEQYAGGSWQPIGVITSNLTLNVATTGNDTTGLGTAGAPWATPHRAMEYLSQYAIKQGVTVTVSVADGAYTFTTPLNLNHPNGSQIFINGGTTSGARPTTSLTGGNAVGNTGATLAANDALLNAYYNTKWQFNGCHGLLCDVGGGVNVNTVLIRGNAAAGFNGVMTGNFSGGTGYASSTGINLGSTVAVHNFGSFGITTLYGGSIWANAVTVTNNNNGNILADHGGSISAQGAIATNSGSFGVATSYGGSIEVSTGVARYNNTDGITTIYGGSINAANATASNNGGSGIVTNFGGSIYANNATASNNAANGIQIYLGGSIYAEGATASNNGTVGIVTQYGGSLEAQNATASNNGTNGIYTNFGGSISANFATASNNGSNGIRTNFGGSISVGSAAATGNGGTDIIANGAGIIKVNGGTTYGTISPAVNTVGNLNAAIST